jgi:tRNA(Ile)-lysidine synthase
MAAPPSVEPGLDALLGRAVRALTGEHGKLRFGVAVSGGPDSMALLDLAAHVFPGRVEAATVDHGLRQESADEAAMVAQWCRDRGIPHEVLHPANPLTGNVQRWARLQRYAALELWRTRRNIDWLFTAHHADDQLETVLMRLNRGAGVSGLAGIRARQGHILRPLLGARRAQLLEYAQSRQIPFVNDPSNTDTRFDRAMIRQHLAGADWIDPQATVRSAAALAECEEALNWIVDGLEARHVRARGAGWLLDRTDFPRELLRRLLLRMLAKFDPDASPRGDTLDRAIGLAAQGSKASIGSALLEGGEEWVVSLAPARR